MIDMQVKQILDVSDANLKLTIAILRESESSPLAARARNPIPSMEPLLVRLPGPQRDGEGNKRRRAPEREGACMGHLARRLIYH